MSQLVLSKGNPFRKNLLQRFLPNIELGPFLLIGSLVVFVILITVITLMFSTRQVTKGYVLDSMDIKHNQLIKEREVKDMQISEVRALKFIMDSPKVRSMHKADQLVFVSGDTSIASR